MINSTPIISLAVLDDLYLLDGLYPEIYIPLAVFKEVTKRGKKKASAIEAWGKNKVREIINADAVSGLKLSLDEGEAEVIVLSQEIKADLVIIDEDKARKIARLYKFNVTGTIGILLDAKKHGKINLIKGKLKKLIKEGIYISDELYKTACLLADED